MVELLRNRRLATAAVVLFGGSLVVGCGNTVEGVGNVPMVKCSANGTPRSNEDTVQDVPKGEVIQMGSSIVTGSHGSYPATGDFSVQSEGSGNFRISIDDSNHNNNNTSDHTAIIPNYPGTPNNTTTLEDNGELFTITGMQGPNGSTGLIIHDRCLSNS